LIMIMAGTAETLYATDADASTGIRTRATESWMFNDAASNRQMQVAPAPAQATAPAAVAVVGPSVRYGRPTLDFAAAPSLFVTEDLRQEDFSLAHRSNINAALGQSEVYEAEAVAVRRKNEADAAAALAAERAAAAYAAETREIERAATAQRAGLEAKFRDAQMAAEAAVAQAEEYRQMLASSAAEQARAQAEHATAAAAANTAATVARDIEFGAVTARLANDNCFAERRALELQGHRGPFINSAIAARTPYTSDGQFGGTAGASGPTAPIVQSRQRSGRNAY